MTVPIPTFTHLRHLTDAGGLYEHADHTTRRREHGYCVDDVARALVVVCRDVEDNSDLRDQYVEFLLAAETADGRFRNRRGADLAWHGAPAVDDSWGRAVWGLGSAIAAEGGEPADARVLAAFSRATCRRAPWSRSMAFAALGAAAVLGVRPAHRGARALLVSAIRTIGTVPPDGDWIWPEPRLTYANAALPEALIAAGHALGRPLLLADGLRMLDWLLALQMRDGHLSVVPVGGRGPGESTPGFDQQPIEVAALADACARAHDLTGERRWAVGVQLSVDWFLGANDSSTSLYDADSGGGCDGLERFGRNENQGAESTIALVSTLQHSRRLALCPR